MPLLLSYPGLRSILEHLEAVKRAHIIARSPGLQKINKLIPLCLKDLCINSNDMTINKLWITCDKDGVNFAMNRKIFIRQSAESQEDKMKKLINFYICGRSIIHVGRLSWDTDFLPVDLKLRVNSLSVFSHWEFEAAIPSIDPRSFPLKTMITRPETSNFDDQIVQLAETLILHVVTHRIVSVEDLKKLNNKTVVFEDFSSSRVDIIPLIKYHIETKKDIGTTFVIPTDCNTDKYSINEMLYEFEQAFGDFRCDLDDVNERFIPGSYKFSIPINNESRIQVYAIEDPEKDGRWKIVIRPVSEVSGL
ncbi:hypothetical protein GCK72_007877 [Caenorhabditis remanei]|uniref:DUF38 domain-containing protein n=1 Tax=Caenorhabditis remanei TaxID=31234 RepID=A0A6A5HNM1_CAERE|nr:hypothetical protein GCK72_007877 [Caenorhabditis remanei]KAF1767917.1 hypothetical protein GCK72_007877 [Caenorhabditis remanei]